MKEDSSGILRKYICMWLSVMSSVFLSGDLQHSLKMRMTHMRPFLRIKEFKSLYGSTYRMLTGWCRDVEAHQILKKSSLVKTNAMGLCQQ